MGTVQRAEDGWLGTDAAEDIEAYAPGSVDHDAGVPTGAENDETAAHATLPIGFPRQHDSAEITRACSCEDSEEEQGSDTRVPVKELE